VEARSDCSATRFAPNSVVVAKYLVFDINEEGEKK